MFSEWLEKVLTRSGHAPDGCGMSTRPSYYSGRGATTSDLNDSTLEKIWTAIKANRGEEAAHAFVLMVEAIPVLSATEFLITLAALDRDDYEWTPERSKSVSRCGVDVARKDDGSHDEVGAFFTVVSALVRGDRDDTWVIRNAFLVRHGRKPKADRRDRFNCYGWNAKGSRR
jgi:hypothetical protein